MGQVINLNFKKLNLTGLFKPRLSLTLKLVIAFSLLIALVIGTITYVATYTTKAKFDQFLTRDQLREYNRNLSSLANYYKDNNGWIGVQSLINEMGDNKTNSVVLTGLQGQVLGKHNGDLLEDISGSQESWLAGTVTVDSKPVAKLYLMRKGKSPIASAFIDSVSQSVLLAGLVAGIAGLLMVLFFSRTIVGPLKKLTAVVKELPEGKLTQRVDVRCRDEVSDLASAFNTMVEELRKNEKLRQDMVSDIAHELRNPTANLQGYLESMKDGIMEPNREILESLYEESKLLHKLIEDLQDLAKAEAGELQLDVKSVSLNDLINQTVDSVRHKLEEKNLSLSVDGLSENGVIRVDVRRVCQVLRNLLENAVRYSYDGGQITISAETEQDKQVVKVSDNGMGILKDDLPYVFERFYRADKSRSRSTGGSGLGLTISKQIIEAHGGEITVDSQEGEGTTFTFWLPVPRNGSRNVT